MKSVSVVLPILAPTPFLRDMADFAIRSLRHHADNRFELVVVEAMYEHFKGHPLVDKHLFSSEKVGAIVESNLGIDMCEGEYILMSGTDVIAPIHWDTELLRLFDRPDCGCASLSAFEPGVTIGPDGPLDMVVEGMFSPFMMFKKGWKWSEDYERVYQDSDLILRMYEQGLRAFRSCRAHVWHLGSVTNNSVNKQKHLEALARDERLFYERWGSSPLMMFSMIRSGQIVYGREHMSRTKPINLHYKP